jgi:hypothetical protein
VSRDIGDLFPGTATKVLRLLRDCRAAGLLPIVCRTWSSAREQDDLFFRGRDLDGTVVDRRLIVTNVRGGHSWHNVERDGRPASMACDVLLVAADRKALPGNDPGWDLLGQLAEKGGLTWGGRWGDNPKTKKIEGWDKGHVQDDDQGTLTLEAAMRGADPS